MPEIYLLRHGQSTWNSERRWAGHADPPLTELGRQQAETACLKLRDMGFESIVSSSLQRAKETAFIISNNLKIEMLDPISDLNERHSGEISGLSGYNNSEENPIVFF